MAFTTAQQFQLRSDIQALLFRLRPVLLGNYLQRGEMIGLLFTYTRFPYSQYYLPDWSAYPKEVIDLLRELVPQRFDEVDGWDKPADVGAWNEAHSVATAVHAG